MANLNLPSVEEYIELERARLCIPGVSLAIIHNGWPIKQDSFGFADLEQNIPAKINTVFHLGSVAKQFTATAVLLLAEEKNLDLNRRLKDFLKIDSPWDNVTLRQLLTHTTGIKDKDKVRSDTTYSNDGYRKLGDVIDLVLNNGPRKSWSQFLEKDIFQRTDVNMQTVQFVTDPWDMEANKSAKGYEVIKGKLRRVKRLRSPELPTAEGSLAATLVDLGKWEKTLSEKKVLKTETYGEMWEPQEKVNYDGQEFDYGFGWFIHQYYDDSTGQKEKIVWHDGSWQGFSACFSRFIAPKVTVILLANRGQLDLWEMTKEIAARFLGINREHWEQKCPT